MTTNIGINGFGRVGRQTFRASLSNPDVRVVAINDPFLDVEGAAHAIRYDSAAGRFKGTVEVKSKNLLIVNGSRIAFTANADPATIPWAENSVSYVIECSGVFTTAERAAAHLAGGAQRVVVATVSADAPPIVLGANEETFRGTMQVIAAGSCTAVALAPILKAIGAFCGVKDCVFTAIHSASGGKTTDGTNGKDLRSARTAMGTITPTATGAVRTIVRVLPKLTGKVAGTSVRVPTASVSLLDINVTVETPTTKTALIAAIAASQEVPAADPTPLHASAEPSTPNKQQPSGNSSGSGANVKPKRTSVVAVTYDPVISADFVGDTNAAVIDCTASMGLPSASSPSNAAIHPATGALPDDVMTTNFKLLAWYDNETGYAQRLVDIVAITSAVWQ
jgi:glyceraldehyde 3-phosphate dehydrogenase